MSDFRFDQISIPGSLPQEVGLSTEVRVSTSFLICFYENLFGSICCFSLNSINYSSCCSKNLD